MVEVEELQTRMNFDDSLLFDSLVEVDWPKPGELNDETSDDITQLHSALQAGYVLAELGYPCSASPKHCEEVLQLFPLQEADVAVILATVARTHSSLEDVQGAHATFCSVLLGYASDFPVLTTWHMEHLVEALKHLTPRLHWKSVIENLDHKGFFVPDQRAFELLISLYTRCSREPFPVQAVCGAVWKNTEGQLSFLKHAVASSPDIFSFASSRRLVLPEGFQRFPSANPDFPWVSLQLTEVVCRLAEVGHADTVRHLLDYPSKHAPEVLLLGLSQVKTDLNLIQTEYCPVLFAGYLTNSQNSSLVLHHLWCVNPAAVTRAVTEIYSNDSSTISRLLEICEQELNVLTSVLSGLPFSFAIELAALARRREYLDLEWWLRDNLGKHRDPFYKACLTYLRNRVELTGQLALPLDILSTFFKCLYSHSASLSSKKLSEELKELHSAALRSNPQLLHVGAEQLSAEGFSSDVEVEANSYFHKTFSGELAVDDVIQMLQRFSTSSVERERDLCACMIHCLFEEYRFFPRYPEPELRITSILFGKLINHGLVSSLMLGVALRGVLDALRKPVESKMFKFGLGALEQFKERLPEWPPYCHYLRNLPHLPEAWLQIIDQASQEDAGASNENQNAHVEPAASQSLQISQEANSVRQPVEERPRSAGSSTRASQSLSTTSQLYDMQKGLKQGGQRPARTASVPVRHLASTPGFGHALNIETLVAAAERRDARIENPSPEIEDKVAFLINNLSVANMELKAKEFAETLEEKYYPWFAQYMVMKRASIEYNFHDTYLKFLDHLNLKALNKEILKATYENCKVLLKSDLIKSSSEERSLLKNLGLWLGRITIGKNQVLRAIEIDPKSLIIEAYEKGLMIAVLPFTAKILEPCRGSPVYRPPNPWTMSILNLLAEIYTLPNLKMNLKFEVEVIFRNLGVDLKDLKPSQHLKGRKRETDGNPDFATKDIVSSAEHSVVNHADFLPPELAALPTSHTATSVSSSQHVPPGTNQDDEKASSLVADRAKPPATSYSAVPNLHNYVVLNNSKLGLNSGQLMQLQRVVPVAMERAIREIITPVVERSVTIACMTTRDLIMKDFSMETDDNRTMHSANLMVASLAGSLAHVTCKEPLRVAMTSHIRSLYQAHISASAEYIDQIVHSATNDNLDLGCAMIEKSATERAIRELEEILGPILAGKRSQRDVLLSSYGQANAGGVARLPEALRPKPGRLSPGQQRVFEDFARLHWQNQASQPPPQPVAAPPATISSASVVSRPAFPAGHGAFANHSSSVITQTLDVSPEELETRNPSPPSFSDVAIRQQEAVTETLTMNEVASPSKVPAGTSVPGAPEHLEHPIEASSSPGIAASKDDLKTSPRDMDPAGLREQVITLFEDWIRVYNTPGASDKTYNGFMSQLSQMGLLKWDDLTDRFFKILTELAIAHCQPAETSLNVPYLSFTTVDMYAKFVVRLLKYYALDSATSKVNMLNRVLNVTVRVIQRDADEKKTAFQPRPYFRLFCMWFMDFNSPDPPLDNFQVLAAFSNAFILLQPLKVPAYSFVWLELISHRMFMPKQLLSHSQKGWPLFQRLLVALFKFMDPYLRNAELSDPVRLLYKGTLRVLLVLLHDFPEFLCEYHFSFCDVIPPSCIQMRNLILSAFPRNMRLPDPFTPNLKVDLLPEISQSPRILSDVEAALKSKQLKAEVDEYLKNRQSLSLFFIDLKQRLMLPQHEALTSGTRYNVPLMNSLVLYVGIQAIQQLQSTPQQLAVPTAPITHSAPMDIFQKLITELDTEGRYLFLNAIANQLRYPNNHTHYFSCVLLYLFAEAGQEIIQEQVTRVLLERLIVNRPHPWGLLITFIELIKNPRYSFWSHAFTRCAPEIERLFDSVARSCMGAPKSEDELATGLQSEAIKG